MSARNISTQILIARKDHRDDSADWLLQDFSYIRSSGRLTFSELRTIAHLKANNWMIKKGQLYERQYNEQDGETFTFKTLPAIGKICTKLGLYEC